MVVRCVTLKLWSVAVLLVARMVLGEFAHALPQHTDEQTATAESSVAVDCPDHAESDEEHPTGNESASHTTNESSSTHHGSDCCKTTCECACVHITPVAGVLPNATLGMLNSMNIAGPSVRPFGPVLSGIFRPPA